MSRAEQSRPVDGDGVVEHFGGTPLKPGGSALSLEARPDRGFEPESLSLSPLPVLTAYWTLMDPRGTSACAKLLKEMVGTT
jgi:hypothetical protein